MNLAMDIGKAEGFQNQAQIARVVSEDWARRNLYCPACTSDDLTPAPNNTKVFDFTCPRCVERFQLKSSKRWDERRIPDAGYGAMMEAISTNNNPNLFVMHYDNHWTVQNLVLIPSFFLSGSAIEKRKALHQPREERDGSGATFYYQTYRWLEESGLLSMDRRSSRPRFAGNMRGRGLFNTTAGVAD
jgi:hypothetical protein